MIHIHFIINPISGSGKHNLRTSYLENFFPTEDFKITINYTKHKGHATILTKKAILQKANYIVACGGDGTINEVASCLVGTKIILGIIPVGSGNGLASNLNIQRDHAKAIAIIKNGKTIAIDVGTVNDQYFFSNMGIGIDALIIKKYDRYRKRKLSSYVTAALSSSFKFKSSPAIISIEDQSIKVNPFMLFVSNSNVMGYNMSLTPKASLQDGLLDIVVIPELSFFEKLILGFNIITNSIETFKKAKNILVTDLHIEMPEKIFIDTQIDGELHNLKTNHLTIGIIHNGLQVLV